MLKVNGAWYLNNLPYHMVIELENGDLRLAAITPMEPIENKLSEYNGYHPRKCSGVSVPSYLYRFYGMEKTDESSSEIIHIRISPSEKVKVDELANQNKMNTSEFVRNLIRNA